MDPAMWTGSIELERLRHDHRAEYERLAEAGLAGTEERPPS